MECFYVTIKLCGYDFEPRVRSFPPVYLFLHVSCGGGGDCQMMQRVITKCDKCIFLFFLPLLWKNKSPRSVCNIPKQTLEVARIETMSSCGSMTRGCDSQRETILNRQSPSWSRFDRANVWALRKKTIERWTLMLMGDFCSSDFVLPLGLASGSGNQRESRICFNFSTTALSVTCHEDKDN